MNTTKARAQSTSALSLFERTKHMNWALFCQIEIIILTVGLVASFIISMNQTAKDNSFFKRISTISKSLYEALGIIGKNMPKKENADDK